MCVRMCPCCLLQYDKDESGTIDFEEFLDMAKVGSRTKPDG